MRQSDKKEPTDHHRTLRGEVHLWLSPIDAFPDSDAFKRRVLSNYCGLEADEISFRYGEHGKPELDQGEPACQFNISHSSDWIVCAVTADTAIGVDIEQLDRTPKIMKLARRFFHADEVEGLAALSEREQKDYFFDLWTLKEAGSKAHGHALAPQLSEREFELLTTEIGQPQAMIRSLSDDDAYRCLLDPVSGHRLALNMLWRSGSPPRIRLYVSRAENDWESVAPVLRASS